MTAKTAAYTLAASDVGQGISTSTGVTVPPNATVPFAIGDSIALYNASAATIAIAQGAAVTLRLAGSATSGNRTLAQRGLATLIKVGTDEWVMSGMGVA